jgi:hypothetical protein
MLAIAFFGGLILLTDLQLLGLAMRTHPIADVAEQLRVPKRYWFLLAVTCGVLMLGCKAEEYYFNAFFRAKAVLLLLVVVHALVFRGKAYDKVAEFDREGRVPDRAKLAASLSLLLWAGIACMGRGIGYIEPPLGIHAQLFRLLHL